MMGFMNINWQMGGLVVLAFQQIPAATELFRYRGGKLPKGQIMRNVVSLLILGLFLFLLGCSSFQQAMEQPIAGVICETEFRKLERDKWRIGYAKEYGIVEPKGLRLYATYFDTAVVWYRKPLPNNTDVSIEAKYIVGGHPLVVLLSGLGAGGGLDTGYSIELGIDANTHGVLKRLGEVKMDSPRAVLSLGENHLLRIKKRGASIEFYLGGNLIFSYEDKEPLTGESHGYLGFGLGKHYHTPHTHGNSEAIINYIRISESIATTHGTKVHFPDPNLQAAIREVLKSPDALITETSLADLTQFEAQDRNISDLSGIEYCINLTELELSHNHRIEDITPLSNLRKLRRIELNHNRIDDLTPLRELTRLEVLGLVANRLTEIRPISSLTNLKLLRLRHNQIFDITPLSKLTRLEWLDISENQITDIRSLVGLKRLRLLRLVSNPIRDDELLNAIKKRGIVKE